MARKSSRFDWALHLIFARNRTAETRTEFDLNESLHHVSKNLRIVSLCTLVSRVLGLMRDQAMSVLFGAGPVMDAFTLAFRLPNLARVLLGEGALTTAFLPVFVAEHRERGTESAARVSWAVFISVAVLLFVLIAVAEAILLTVYAIVPLGPEAQLLCQLTSILLPYLLLICLAAQVAAVLNATGRFLWPALVPAILNLAWLIALWQIVPLWDDPINRIHATAWSVLIGGALQLLFPLPILFTTGFGYRSDWRQAMDRVWKIARDMLPVVLGLSITQLNAVMDSFIAWGFTQSSNGGQFMPLPGSPTYPLPQGTVTALYLGQRLYQFPLGVFAVALGTVLFPLLTSHAQRREFEKLRADLSLGLRLVVAIGLPASAGLMLIAHPLAVLFFQYGEFDASAAQRTGSMIAMYGSGVWAYCGLLILQRGFYSIEDRLTPMYIGLAAMLGNAILDLSLIWPLGGRGLALSTALIAVTQCVATAVLLQRRVGTLLWAQIGVTTVKTLIATCGMAVACLMTQNAVQDLARPASRLIRLGAPLLVAIAVFLALSLLLGLREPWSLLTHQRPQKAISPDRAD